MKFSSRVLLAISIYSDPFESRNPLPRMNMKFKKFGINFIWFFCFLALLCAKPVYSADFVESRFCAYQVPFVGKSKRCLWGALSDALGKRPN